MGADSAHVPRAALRATLLLYFAASAPITPGKPPWCQIGSAGGAA